MPMKKLFAMGAHMLGDIENAAEEEDANEDLFAMGARMLGNIESDAEEEMQMKRLCT